MPTEAIGRLKNVNRKGSHIPRQLEEGERARSSKQRARKDYCGDATGEDVAQQEKIKSPMRWPPLDENECFTAADL